MATSFGLLKVQSLKDLEQQEQEKAKKESALDAGTTSRLLSHIKKAWNLAKEAKRPVEQAMIKALRAKNGVYEPEKLAAIREMGGSELYIMLTHTKTRAFEAWVNDILRPAGDKPWEIYPTPVSDLPGDVVQAVEQEVTNQVQQLMVEAQGLNVLEMPEVQTAFQEFVDGLYDTLKHLLQEEAEEAATRMSKLILDQQIQGNFINALKQVISDIGTLKAGILKGPVVRMRKINKWQSVNGQWVQGLVDELVPEFDRVSPFDFYPAPGSESVEDGDIIERHRLTRSDLVSLIGVPGYDESAVRRVLSKYDSGTSFETLAIDSERYLLEHGETSTMNRTGKIEALEYWGSVPGSFLNELNMGVDVDPELEYEINAWVIGDEIIKAVINPDKLGRKPYSVTSFEKVPGSIWGRGIPELMADIQDVCNAIGRAIVNNSQLASGPMVEVNIDKCDSNTAMYPWKIFQSTTQTMNEAAAVKFYQPTMYSSALLEVFEFFSLAADEATGVPRWAYGNTNIGGAGNTSSGLSMLMTYAARGIKQVIQNIDDDILSTVLQRHYDYNMLFYPDPEVKGDMNIVARGATALMAKEQQILRLKDILLATANPVDIQLVGLEARFDMIKSLFKALELPVEHLPDPNSLPAVISTLKQQIEAQQAALAQQSQDGVNVENQAAQMSGQAPQRKSPQYDVAGNTAGGADTSLYKEQGAIEA